MGVTLRIFRREASARLASPWLYAIGTTACIAAWLYGAGFARSFATESVLVATDPLMALNILVVIFLALVLGVRLASSIAWEREHGTLEVLLVGPVPMGAVIAAKFLVEVSFFAVLMIIYVVYFLTAQPLGAGVIGLTTALAAGQMPLHALPTLSLGLLISAWSRTVRGAVAAYLVCVGFLAAFEIVVALLRARPVEELSLAGIYLKALLEPTGLLLKPVSPIGHLSSLVEGLTAQAPPEGRAALVAIALTAVTLGLAVVLARTRGAGA